MDAQLITIWGRSGAGKSTLAVNMACALAENHCVGLISSNLQYGRLQSFFGHIIDSGKGLLNALEDPSHTTEFFEGRENLFLLSVPNNYTGLLADTISRQDVEWMLDRARPYFEYLIIDGSGDITNPVSSVAMAQSERIITLHKPSAASCLWYHSMRDFIYQLHLTHKLTHVIQDVPWSIQEYASALRITAAAHMPFVTDAPQLEDNGTPIYYENNKSCRQYKKVLGQFIQQLGEVVL